MARPQPERHGKSFLPLLADHFRGLTLISKPVTWLDDTVAGGALPQAARLGRQQPLPHRLGHAGLEQLVQLTPVLVLE